jgi:VanZ family protein
LGISSTNFQAWQGQVRGLAVYDAELTAVEVSAHYVDWIAGDAPGGAGGVGHSDSRGDPDPKHALARYTFTERSGSEIHSEVASAPPITIPQYLSVPRKPMLNSPANEFQASKIWLNDVAQNIVGFMPLGFVLGGYFALRRSRLQAILLAWLCGGFLSFTIEFLQYYVPRRGSGWTDVITNSTGTLLGALLARPEWVRGALRLVKLVPAREGKGDGARVVRG